MAKERKIIIFLAGLCSKSFIGYALISALLIYPFFFLIILWGALRDGIEVFWDTLVDEFEDVASISRDNYDNVCEFYNDHKKNLASSDE